MLSWRQAGLVHGTRADLPFPLSCCPDSGVSLVPDFPSLSDHRFGDLWGNKQCIEANLDVVLACPAGSTIVTCVTACKQNQFSHLDLVVSDSAITRTGTKGNITVSFCPAVFEFVIQGEPWVFLYLLLLMDCSVSLYKSQGSGR